MRKWFFPNGVPPRRKKKLLYSHMLHLQAKTESDAILPTTEPAFTQKNEAKVNSEVHDQRSKRKPHSDNTRHPGQPFAAALHSNLQRQKHLPRE
jgi:hypothetical protein